ncbi:MAG: peptidylprolyl isomerase [Runella sp.]
MKLCLFVVCLGLCIIWGCQTTKPAASVPTEPIILTIGNKSFTTDEFFQSFTRNQFSDDTTKPTDIGDYFQQYTILKIKALGAQREGYDTTEDFREQMASYRKHLAQPYLTDKTLVENLVAEAYQRMKEEVRTSHILIPVSQDASPADTLAAYRAAVALRGRIVQQEISFEETAQKYSKDVATASKGGDTGYFSVFQTVYPFESAAYSLPLGQISNPIRTNAGYHLIKTTDRRPSRGKIRVAHILVRISPNAHTEGQQAAKAKIDRAYQLLKQESWDIVCRDFSDDITSKNNGGLLQEFGTGTMTPAFEEAAFALKNIGDISQPFQTNYGWHIVKLINRKPLESFAELAPQLTQKVTTDSRGELVKKVFINRLRTAYKINEIASARDEAFAALDSTLLRGQWKKNASAPNATKTLLMIDNRPLTIGQFYEYVYDRQTPTGSDASLAVVRQRYYRQFIDRQLLQIEEENLEKKYTDFRFSMNEMREGVLLKQLMTTHVWEKALTDSLGQRQYWEQHKEKYTYPERAFATIVATDNDTIFKRAKEMLAILPYPLRRKANDLLFVPKSSDLTPAHREVIFDVALQMLNNESYIVEISAYNDESENDSLALARLQHTVKALINSGVSPLRIIEKSYGKFRPVANPARNRRISFQFFSTSTKEVEKSLNALKIGQININEGAFAKNSNPYLAHIEWKEGSYTTRVNGKNVWV